ncbi:MAG: hypothetical protein KKA73_28860 [Chloroflexi bacterium]|nr:hypothetical protein [Chloroflexota bacterium]MBU1751705.1 hypothetical protein [Chloroflexota bacterium]
MQKKHVDIGFDIPWPKWGRAWTYARRWLLPNPGTLILMVALVLAMPALAGPLYVPAATSTSTSTISYQGRLADSGGTPLTGKYNLEFRVYDVPTGGTALWTEMWTGANSVDVSDGLFNVMLGSIDSTLASAIEGQDELYLGITVGTDSEMTPRVQLGSVPFSMQALTVSDESITTAKIADGAVTQAKLGPDISLVPPDGSITTAKLADGAATSRKVRLTVLETTASGDITTNVWNAPQDGQIVITGTAEVNSYALVTFSASTYNEVANAGTGISVRVNGVDYGFNTTYRRQNVGGLWDTGTLVAQRLVPLSAGSFTIQGMIHTTDHGVGHFHNRRLSVLLVAQ